MFVSALSLSVRVSVSELASSEIGRFRCISLLMAKLGHRNEGLRLLCVTRLRQCRHRMGSGLLRRKCVVRPVVILGGMLCLRLKGLLGVV